MPTRSADARPGPTAATQTLRRATLVLVAALGLGGLTLPGPTRAVEVTAGAPQGRWTSFASADDILDLALDGDTLWAGTRAGGLVRWSGVGTGEARPHQWLRPQDPIGGNTVSALAIDPAGRVWMATDGGLSVLDDGGTEDLADDRWLSWTVESSFGGLPSAGLTALAIGDDGETIWVGGRQARDPITGDWSGGGVGRLFTGGTWDPSDDRWAPVIRFADTYRQQPDGSEQIGLVSDSITAIALAPGGHVWFATAPHWRKQTSADPEAPPSWQQVHGGLSHVDTKGSPDPDDDRWTGTSCQTTQLTVTCHVQTVAIDPAGRGWAAIGGRGVIHFDPKLDQIPPPVTGIRIAPPPGEGDPFVLDLAFGPAGDPTLEHTVWMGTRGGGLAVLDHDGAYASPNRHRWNFDRGAAFTRGDGLASERLQALAMGAGHVWLGTGPERGRAAGVQVFEPSAERIEPALARPPGPASNFITDIEAGPADGPWADQVWVATGSRAPAIAMRHSGAGLSILDTAGTADPVDDVWQHHDSVSSDDDGQLPWTGIPGDNLQAIAFQGDAAWLGATSAVWDREAGHYLDGGLARFDGQGWTARTVASTGGPESGLGSGSISSLAEGCEGALWVGTGEPWEHDGRGLFELRTGADPTDPAQDQWQRHSHPELASNNLSALAADCRAGRIWAVGTHHSRRSGAGAAWIGGGAAVFDLATRRWQRQLAADGLESYAEGAITGSLLAVASPEGGPAWLGGFGTRATTAGQLIADRPLWPAVLNRLEGASWSHELFERAGWVSALAIDPQGRLWVGTSRGGAARDSAAPESWREDRMVGGLFVRDGQAWARLTVQSAGLPANDVSVLHQAPDGSLWLGTEGWGLARFEPGGATPTATPSSGAASPTPSRTPTRTPTAEPTPTPHGASSPTRGPSRTATTGPDGPLLLPWLAQRR